MLCESSLLRGRCAEVSVPLSCCRQGALLKAHLCCRDSGPQSSSGLTGTLKRNSHADQVVYKSLGPPNSRALKAIQAKAARVLVAWLDLNLSVHTQMSVTG